MNRTRIAPGCYVDDQGRYWARPRINRRSTWRLLKDPNGQPIRKAKVAVAFALRQQWQPAGDTFAVLAKLYLDAGCPDKRLQPRGDVFTRAERIRLSSLTTYFGHHPCDEIRLKLLPAFAAWRMRQVSRGSGERTVDLDLCTLSNVLNYGVAIGQLEMNWIAINRPRYRRASAVRHARVLMPASADVIHQLADHLLADLRSEVFGWMTLFALFTGCRTSELLRLRLDAPAAPEAGFVENGHLFLGRRSKNGTNPWCAIGPEFAQMFECFRNWHGERYPKNPFYFPGRMGGCVGEFGHGHALARAARVLELPHTTPHALRAYYVTKRRRDGIPDAYVAAEIGDKTVALISETYGDVPGGTPLSWTPTTRLPAWLLWQDHHQKIERIA